MNPDFLIYILNLSIAILGVFIINCVFRGRLQLIHKLYILLTSFLLVYLLAILAMQFTSDSRMDIMFVWDASTCIAAAFLVVTMLLIALTFSNNLTELPKSYRWFFLPSAFTSLVVVTNPLHHLFYRHFSIYYNDIVFGPLFFLSSTLLYSFSLIAILITLRCGFRSRHRSYLIQSILLSLGAIIPISVNLLATLGVMDLGIVATPLSFLGTIICHGIAIYAFNFFSIKPVALESILDNINDCYVIVSEEGFITAANRSFNEIFGQLYGIVANRFLADVAETREGHQQDVVYNLINSFENCCETASTISYEQAVLCDQGKLYYSVEMTPLFLRGKLAGVIAMFKDVTKLKESMQREQYNLSRTMERERLASLGQMIGGIAHNLKTPIMSISGSGGALDKLVVEYASSISDPEVTVSDHLEISGEMRQWLSKIQDCCAYMSDIISTVKGLATNMNTSNVGEFSVDEVFKRVLLLMQHRLIRYGCHLRFENSLPAGFTLSGDINNLVQVVSNLVDNSVDAMKGMEGGEIILTAQMQQNEIIIRVIDTGSGIAPEVKEKIFHKMFTTKGAQGTGLGLYISGTLIRGRFDGRMWIEDNPGGGTIVCIAIPTEHKVS